MGKSSKETAITKHEIEQIRNFKDLFNADLRKFGNVWVSHKVYGIIRGKITKIPLSGCKGKTQITLENGKIITADSYQWNKHIKER